MTVFSISDITPLTSARAVRLYEQEQGGAFRLPPAWIVHAAVAELGKRNPLPKYFWR